MLSVVHGNFEIVKLLFENNADTSILSPASENLFHLCAEKGNKQILNFLLEKLDRRLLDA